MLTRKAFLKLMAASGFTGYVMTRGGLVHVGKAAQSSQVPLNAGAIPQFVEPLLDFDYISASSSQIVLNMEEFQTNILPASVYAALPAPYNAGTYVWGYLQEGQSARASYLGPVIIATKGDPT